MTSLLAKRSVKRPAQSKPKGASPAKRSKRGGAATAPRGRESRDTKPNPDAAAHGRRGKRDAAAPAGREDRASKPSPEEAPHARRAKRDAPPAPPCVRKLEPVAPLTSPTLTVETLNLSRAYTLRTRKVFVPDTEKPGPPVYRNGEEVTYDYGASWQRPACAEAALEHYNRLNEDKHELVKAVDSVAFFFDGLWMHVNFLAKLKGATTCVDLVPKYFFAELKVGANEKEISCMSCIKMDPADPATTPVRGCIICPSRIFHPATGCHRGSKVLHPDAG